MGTRIMLVVLMMRLCPWAWGLPIDNGLKLARRIIPGKSLGDKCERGASDIALIIDGSTSIGGPDFQKLRIFLAGLAEDLPDGTHFAAVQFSGTPRTEFTFNTFKDDKAATAKFFRSMPYKKGTTKVALAMQYANREILSKFNRPDVADIVIVITDGRSSDDPTQIANEIRARGVKTLAIGITDLVDEQQLLAIGGSNDTTFRIANFDQLDQKFRQLLASQAVCIRQTAAPSFGEPNLNITCGENGMVVGSETKNPFKGQVYVKGHSQEADCMVQGDGVKSEAFINIPYDKCGTVRRRSQNPPGIFAENTVVFKFHEKVLTKIDQVFKVKCFFMEASKTVTQELEVGALTTKTAEGQYVMPTCVYTIHSGSPDGPELRFAEVGAPIIHKWQCVGGENTSPLDLFKMRVHSCIVGDGTDSPVQLVDENGCAVDKFLLNNLEYAPGGLMAFVEAHVFKFADRPQLFFKCQVELCIVPEDGCPNTPPNCTVLRRRRSADLFLLEPSTAANTVDVITEQISVADIDDLLVDNAPHDAIRASHDNHPSSVSRLVCLTFVETYLFTAATFGSFLLVSSLFVVQQMRTIARCK